MHRTLSQTHERAWGLPWVWERWTKRNKREELTATAKSSPRAFLVKWGQRPKPGEVNRSIHVGHRPSKCIYIYTHTFCYKDI